MTSDVQRAEYDQPGVSTGAAMSITGHTTTATFLRYQIVCDDDLRYVSNRCGGWSEVRD